MVKIFVSRSLEVGQIFQIDAYNQYHLNVIKKNKEEKILIGDSDGREFTACIRRSDSKIITAEILQLSGRDNKPRRYLSLYLSIPKNQKFEDIIFKCTQVGVSEFTPVITSRTVKLVKKESSTAIYERWNKKARHGAELSARAFIPAINNIMSFSEALDDYKLKKFTSGVLFWEEEGQEAYIMEDELSEKMAVFIGPEGGFSRDEVTAASEAGIKIMTLGSLVMDVETASIAASAIILCRKK